MRLARTLLSYIFAVGILCAALISGVMWLVTPDPAVSHEARVAPIPARIADSIERRKPLPVPEPEPAKPAVKETAVMKEAPVSLTPAPTRSFKIRELTPPAKQKRKPRGDSGVARATVPAAPAAAPVVSTGRSDFPY